MRLPSDGVGLPSPSGTEGERWSAPMRAIAMPLRVRYGSALAAALAMELLAVGVMCVAGIGVGVAGSLLLLWAALCCIGRQIV